METFLHGAETLLYTKIIETNIQSNVSVICVLMELAEDVRKGSKYPQFPGESTAFSSPLYSSCESATLGLP